MSGKADDAGISNTVGVRPHSYRRHSKLTPGQEENDARLKKDRKDWMIFK